MANREQDDRVTFRVDFADGTISYMQINAVARGEIPKGKIVSVSRLRQIDPFLGPDP
jgi:hypothetical protein